MIAEVLEVRQLLTADLAVTEVRLLSEADAKAPTMTAASVSMIPIGTLPNVRVDFTTADLPVGAIYNVQFEVQDWSGNVVKDAGGTPMRWTSGNLTGGAGQGAVAQPQYFTPPRLWPLEFGAYSLVVRVDANNAVVEGDEFNNEAKVDFVVAGTFSSAYNNEINLVTPIAGTRGEDWFITNHVDENPNSVSGAPAATNVSDYEGGTQTYNGHEGTDFYIGSFNHQDAGLPVLAAASGTVIEIQDGLPDRNTASNSQGLGNFIGIDHGNGWVTQYGHLRANSMTVQVGDVVAAGDTVGLVGSSGNSVEPHLHFDVLYRGMYVDPFFDSTAVVNPTQYWQDPQITTYAPTVFHVAASGLVGGTAGVDHLNQPPSQRFFQPGSTVTYWAELQGVQSTDAMLIEFISPSGTTSSFTFGAGGWTNRSILWDASNGVVANEVGWWTTRLTRNGNVIEQSNFRVTNNTRLLAGQIEFESAEFVAVEGSSQATITLVRNGSVGTTSVNWETVDDTAKAGTDYIHAAGTVVFNPGEMTKTITIDILDDELFAGQESLKLKLTSANASSLLGSLRETTLTIVDDDQPLRQDGPGRYQFFTAREEQGLGGTLVSIDEFAGNVEFYLHGKRLWLPSDQASIAGEIYGGSGREEFFLSTLPGELYIDTGDGDDLVSLSARNRDTLDTSVVIGNTGGADQLQLSDASLYSQPALSLDDVAYTIDDGLITRSLRGTSVDYFGTARPVSSLLNMSYSGEFSKIDVLGGSTLNHFSVGSVAQNTTLSLFGGALDDVFLLRDAAFTMDAILGEVRLDGRGGFDWAYLDDVGNTQSQQYWLTADKAYPQFHWADHIIAGRVDRTGMSGIQFIDLDQVSIVAGSGDDVATVWNPVEFGFTFAGQDGYDTLDYSWYTGPIFTDFAGDIATGFSAISDFEDVVFPA